MSNDKNTIEKYGEAKRLHAALQERLNLELINSGATKRQILEVRLEAKELCGSEELEGIRQAARDIIEQRAVLTNDFWDALMEVKQQVDAASARSEA